MKVYRLILFALIFLLLSCSHETDNKTTYFETKEEAIRTFFEYEGYNHKNIMAIEEHEGNEIIIFLEKGLGFAFIEQTEKGYRIFFEGPFRDFETEAKEVDGSYSFIELRSVNQKAIPVIVGKIFNEDIRKIAIKDRSNGAIASVPLQNNQTYWYYFYDGDLKFKEINYER